MKKQIIIKVGDKVELKYIRNTPIETVTMISKDGYFVTNHICAFGEYDLKLLTSDNNMDTYNRLLELQEQYPELTFQNDGYEYLSKDIQERHKDQIKEISELLEQSIEGFVRFDNFKISKGGRITVRVQYHWDPYFIGVGYFHIEDFKP